MPAMGRGGTMRGPTAFWRALERARQENLRDAGEAMPIAGNDGQTRRQVLLVLSAIAATAALPRPARALAGGGGPPLRSISDTPNSRQSSCMSAWSVLTSCPPISNAGWPFALAVYIRPPSRV